MTSIEWIEGQHNVTLYVNDTSGNENFSSVTFYIDTIFPDINITSPLNNTNITDNLLDINYTVSDLNLQTCKNRHQTF